MTERQGFTARELVGLLPGGWSLADATDPGEWDESSGQWRSRLVDGADVPHELVVSATDMDRHGRTEALRRELDRVYRSVARRGLLG
ncbi:MAG: hypothetical protein ACE5EG_00035 [Thermoanaerobaculia bacterium]